MPDIFESLSSLPQNAVPATHGAAPTSEKRRKKNEDRKEINKDDDSKHASRESTKQATHDAVPTSEKRGKKNESRKKIDKNDDSKRASKKSSKHQDDIEDIEHKNAIRRHDDIVTTAHWRRSTSNIKISDRSTIHKNFIALEQSQKRSLLFNLSNYFMRLIKIVIKTTSKLLRLFYLACKWILVNYIIWLVITHLLISIHRLVTTKMTSIYSIKWIGSNVFCESFDLINLIDRSINVLKVATFQEVLAFVTDRARQNFDLARDMIDHKSAVRELEIRVVKNKLVHKWEIYEEFESLFMTTKLTVE